VNRSALFGEVHHRHATFTQYTKDVIRAEIGESRLVVGGRRGLHIIGYVKQRLFQKVAGILLCPWELLDLTQYFLVARADLFQPLPVSLQRFCGFCKDIRYPPPLVR
jgi:hypothetical protein